jgi:hypothetical protein
MAEKRCTERYPKKIPVKFGFGNLLNNGEIENISLSGIFMHTDAIYATRTVIKIEYNLPKYNIVGICGEVKWKRASTSQWIQTGKKNGLGIRIVKFYSGEQNYNEMISELQKKTGKNN